MTKISVDIDLSEIETDDLVEELRSRGDYPTELSEAETNDLLAELQARDDCPNGWLLAVLDEPPVMAWLRDVNPPQAIRDAVYGMRGVIL